MPNQGKPKLKKGDITIQEMIEVSRAVYGKEIDNKIRRQIDIIGARVTGRRGLSYDRKTKTWGQTSFDVKFEFVIQTDPTSYKKQDTVKTHRYPIIFLIRDWNKGFNSPFRSRVGGLARWKPAKYKLREAKDDKQKKEWKKQNLKILNANIRLRKLQANFIFNQMFIRNAYGILYGPMTCTPQKPSKTNPTLTPAFEKHEWYIVTKILPGIFKNPKLNQKFSKK
jgi:hypothetical protein